jgi:hypothetical protein
VNGSGACPACGRRVDPGQEYCIECGARLPRPHGVVAALGGWWRGKLPGYPGDWIWPSLAALAVAAGGAAAAIAATGGAGAGTPATLTLTSALAEPSKTVAAQPASRRAIPWPRANGYTIVLATIPVADGGRAAREKVAEAFQARLPQVGVLLSSNFASLHPGYYVVFSGVYGSQDDAQAALPTASRRFPNAAVRAVTR